MVWLPPLLLFLLLFLLSVFYWHKKKLSMRKIETLNHHSNFNPPPPHSLPTYLNWGVSFPIFLLNILFKILSNWYFFFPYHLLCISLFVPPFVILSLEKKRKRKCEISRLFSFCCSLSVSFLSIFLPTPNTTWVALFISLP